jgi:hypothetical protein
MAGAAFVATANAVADAIRFPVLDVSPLPGLLPHLGSAGTVSLSDADPALGAGNSEWKKGRPHQAIEEWSKVARNYGRSVWAIPALLNIGHAASHAGDRKAAITAFKGAIETPDSQPKRPRQGWWDIDRDELHKHQACVELSDLFLEIGDSASALKYTQLALETYKFSSPCGTANATVRYELQERIDAIKSALATGRPLAIEPRSTALARAHADGRRPEPAHPAGRVK